MHARTEFTAETAQVDQAAIAPLPNSRKIYVEGSRPDIRVPMREVAQADTPTSFGGEANPPIFVYDTAGAYSDPAVAIDIRSGLAPLRAAWIAERGDTEQLVGPSSAFGQERLAEAELAALRFNLQRQPRRAKPGANVSQMHYARRGIVTPEMEFVAIRENLNRAAYVESLRATGKKGERMAQMLLR
ncbi:MAG: phosphomethylpyrimidine synthase ThiC, partial [Burkholderiaceae bacterium]